MDDVFEVPAHYQIGAENRCQCDVRRVVAGSRSNDPACRGRACPAPTGFDSTEELTTSIRDGGRSARMRRTGSGAKPNSSSVTSETTKTNRPARTSSKNPTLSARNSSSNIPEHGGVGIDSERSLHTYHYHSDLILANAPSDSVVGESEHVYFTDPAFESSRTTASWISTASITFRRAAP